ncbi:MULTISPECIES: phage tail tape measure protein [Atopobium]|uniref:Phage tail tape measure protein, TP901 family, core region n=1 Tax=Atopobium minutum 10063974 TaxID=997872 RepID=N2BJM4_9ACTN|nr:MULTISPECIES: phage tail tape measure protein [Atopobium]EMZ41932.1 phage tail tape measure protein, TP901 family, core region [Atopobium minutum 10063974]ERL14547.1 tail tape measure protein, TIGR01760 family [Atopobium sp. BV3Ac4]MDU5357184.1 phage tail tape measure protein [Atopobium minutum]
MASRIKGITVEIGGDTTGLDKALKNVQSTIRTTQSSLRDVNRLLKLDPKNTELLAQKQKMLKDAIVATKEKLDTLKTASEQAKAQLESGDLGQDKYDALQREIAETEEKLRGLQQEAVNTNSVFSKMDATGAAFTKAGDSITTAGQKVMPFSLAVGGLGVAAVKTAGDFDAAMSQVAAVSGATGDDFQALRDKAREMGATTKFSATDGANALSYMAQAGWSTEQMLDGIDGVMNLAASSGEDLAAVSDIVVGSLSAFGLKASDAAHFADVLAAAAAASNTDVHMMGEAFEYAAPVAGALGFSIEDTSEAIGLLSNSGIKASQAGTSLRTIFNSLSKDVTISGDAIGDAVVKTTNADGSMRSLNDILGDCREAFSGLTESEKVHAAEQLVGKNAMSGFLALMNAAPEDIDTMRNALTNSTGAAEEMAKVMQDNLPGQIEELKSAMEELAISIGDALMPTIRNIVSWFQALVDKLNSMDEGTRNTIIKIGVFIAALGPLLLIVGKVVLSLGSLITTFSAVGKTIGGLMAKTGGLSGIFTKLGAAIGGISLPVVAIVAVIATLVAAFVHLWNTSEDFRNSIIATWNQIKESFTAFADGIVERVNALGFNFQSFGELISAIWNGFTALLAPVFQNAFTAIAAILQGALDILTSIFDIFAGLFTGNWSQLWNGIKEVFSGIWTAIAGIFTAAWETLVGVTNTVLGWFGTNWSEVWTAIKTFFKNTWNGIVSFFTGIWEGIKSVVTGAVSAVSNTVSSVFTVISTTASNIWNSIKDTISGVVNGIKSTVSNVFNTVKSTVTNIFNGIKSTATSVWNGIKSAITRPIEAAKNTIKGIVDKIKGFFSGLHIELPHIKLPHFSISGGFSIVPPRVPHLSIDWYKEGGIMARPTLFGMNGSSLMAGGEAGAEAILPLKGFYDKLETMLAQRDTSLMEKYLSVIAGNSEKDIVLDSGLLVGALAPKLDGALGRRASYVGRRMT